MKKVFLLDSLFLLTALFLIMFEPAVCLSAGDERLRNIQRDQRDLNIVESQIEEYKRQLGALNSQKREMLGKIAVLNEEIEKRQKAAELMNDIIILEQRRMGASGANGKQDSSEIGKLEAAIESIDRTVRVQKRELSELTLKERQMTKEIAGLQSNIESAEYTAEAIEKDIDAQMKQIEIKNISGSWYGRGKSTYFVEQTKEGDISWTGKGEFIRKIWIHKAEGKIFGNKITATYNDEPGSAFGKNSGRVTGTVSDDGKTIEWSGAFNPLELKWWRTPQN